MNETIDYMDFMLSDIDKENAIGFITDTGSVYKLGFSSVSTN